MPPCIEKARAIMRVLTVDMWNHRAKHERTRLWRMYCSPEIKAYTPDGGESTGYEEVCPTCLVACNIINLHPYSAKLLTTYSQCDSQYEVLRAGNRLDWKFELTGDLYLIGNTFMQTWYFGKGVEGVEGWTVITVNTRGEVISLHGVVEDAATNPCKRQQEEEPTNPPPVVALNCTTPSSVAGCAGFDIVTASGCCLAAR